MDSDIAGALLVYMFPIVLYLGLALAVGQFAAKSKGRESVNWFLLSLVLTPLLGFIVVALLSPVANHGGPYRKCPKCAEMVRREATVCRYCRNELTPILEG